MFGITDVTGAFINAQVQGNVARYVGATGTISVSGNATAAYRLNGGAWTAAAGPISSGTDIQLRVTSPTATNASVTVTMAINGTQFPWKITTATAICEANPPAGTVCEDGTTYVGYYNGAAYFGTPGGCSSTTDCASGTPRVEGGYAAVTSACANLRFRGYADWTLPTEAEAVNVILPNRAPLSLDASKMLVLKDVAPVWLGCHGVAGCGYDHGRWSWDGFSLSSGAKAQRYNACFWRTTDICDRGTPPAYDGNHPMVGYCVRKKPL